MKSAADSIKGDGRNIESSIQRMMQAYANYNSTRIEIIWGVLFEVYFLISEDNGNNQYKVPHSGMRRRDSFNAQYVDRHVN